MDIVSLLIYKAISGGGGETPVATDVSYDNTTSGLLADNVQNAIDELSSEKINTSEKGTANGVAELNENGIILTSQLPSYVDDVLEYNTYSDFPQEGESGKIYVDLSTNKTYRWGGSNYVEISPSLALGETSSTAYRGDRGKAAYDHSQLTTGNPHNVTKAQVGLGNVDNTSDLNKPISTATQTALNEKTSVADVEDIIEDTFNDNTVTGNPISFETVIGTEQIKSCKVDFEPIQDLNGQDAPYPAGGGKNKLNATGTITYMELSDGVYTLTSLPPNDISFIVGTVNLGVGTYKINGGISDNLRCYISVGSDTYTSRGEDTEFSITSADTYTVRGVIRTGATVNSQLKPMIRLSTESDSSFAPYSNICPISGWDSVSLNVSGINLFNKNSISAGKNVNNQGVEVDVNNGCCSDYIPVLPNTNYYAIKVKANQTYHSSAIYDKNKTFLRNVSINGAGIQNGIINTGDNAAYIRINTNNDNVSGTMLVFGTTAPSDYIPFKGLTTHTATFPSTVYDGEYEFVEGKATIDEASVLLKDLSWTKQPTYGSFYAEISDKKQGIVRFLAENLTPTLSTVSTASIMLLPFGTIGQNTENKRIYINYGEETTMEDFISAMGNYKVIYELATPTEITLTPETIELLKGNNTLWTDGDNIELVYSADIPSYVEQAIEEAKELPSVTSSDNGKFLGVSSGAWTKVNSPLPSATSSNANNILSVNSIGNYELIKPYIVNFNVGISNGVCSFYDGKRPSDVYSIMYGNGVHAICFLTIYSGADNVKFLSCKFNSSNNLVAYTFYEDSGDLYYEEFVWSLQSSADSSSHTKRKIKELPTVTSSDESKVLTVNSSGEWIADDLPDGTNISY